MTDERTTKREERLAGTCKHFSGIQNAECRAGVSYRSVEDRGGNKPVRLPCFRDDAFSTGKPPPDCGSRCWRTIEEVRAESAESEAAIQKMLANLRAGVCNTCGKPVEPRRQSGRCIYAACGHRIGQGSL